MTDLMSKMLQVPFKSYEQATLYLEDEAKLAGVKHLSYWNLQFIDGTPDHVVWVATYDPLYMSKYMSTFTPMGDPVLERVMDDHVVIDWSEWLEKGVASEIQAAAAEYGITRYGLSLPLHAGAGGKTVFSVNACSNEQRWPQERGIIAKRFRRFAMEFDARMQPLISEREKGKSVYAL